MIKHIVAWKLKATDEAGQARDAAEVKRRLEALVGKVPTLKHLEVGLDFNRSAAAMDVVLYTEFSDRAGLEAYQKHPDHVAVVPFIQSVTADRKVMDYEV